MSTHLENIRLLSDEKVQRWLQNQQDHFQVALKKSPFEGIASSDLATQVKGRKAVAKKLPNLAETKGVIYPAHLSLEQCSSELTAARKATIMRLTDKNRCIDLTGGFGIDTFAFAPLCASTVYVENNEELADIVKHNANMTNCNIEVHSKSAEAFIDSFLFATNDVVFIDPARRHDSKGKVHQLEDCTPNVLSIIPSIIKKVDSIWIKLSPMLDIGIIEKQLSDCLQSVHVLSVNNECKELFIQLTTKVNTDEMNYSAHVFQNDIWSVFSSNTMHNFIPISEVQSYLYEPDVALLKAGIHDEYCANIGLTKLHRLSNLYTSEEPIEGFLGRTLKIQIVFPASQKKLPLKAASIARRNFPVTPEELRKKLKLKESKEDFLYATTLEGEQRVLIYCKRLGL